MTEIDRQFKTDGFVFLKNLLSKTTVEELVQASTALCETSAPKTSGPFKWGYPHAVSKEESLWGTLRQPELLAATHCVLGTDRIAYLEHSDLKVWNRQPASGWHRDSISERFGEGPEWGDESYAIVRVAIYLQGGEEGFEWGCIPGSHALENPVCVMEHEGYEKEKSLPERIVGSRMNYLPTEGERLWISTRRDQSGPTEPIWIATSPGDLILFDPRLIHVGGQVPAAKRAIFFALGGQNRLSRLHERHFGGEELDGNPDLARRRLRKFLESAGLALGGL